MALYRGSLPCRIAFVGEGPGESEDVMGQPFVGPSGILLDDMVKTAELNVYRLGYFNLVACIPRYEVLDEDQNPTGAKEIKDPDKESIGCCSQRFEEMFDMCNPEVVVWVGKLSEKHGVPFLHKRKNSSRIKTFSITHPGALLRMDPSQKDFAIERAVVTLMEVRRYLLKIPVKGD